MPQLAVQLFTLRDYCKTPADIASTFKRLSEMGWGAVQVSAIGEIAPKELKKILDDTGLKCVATHVRPPARLWDDPAGVIDEHAVLECPLTAVGGHFPKGEDWCEANWQGFVDKYNAAAKNFAGTSLRIGYHNHSHELARVGDPLNSPTALQFLVDKLTPDVWFEIDTYWIAHGGGSPAAWLRALAGRVPLIHVKDMGIKPDRTQYMMEVGAGNLDWPGILAASEAAGVETWCVEQDTCWRDPFDSLKTSLENLKAMGL